MKVISNPHQTLRPENILWAGSPSHWLNAPTYLICGMLIWLVFPLFIALWQWMVLNCTEYTLTTERLKIRSGVFNKRNDELELYRVRDYRFEEPFFLRVFSLGNIILSTTDLTDRVVIIRAIRNGDQVRENIRTYVEKCRCDKGVKSINVE